MGTSGSVDDQSHPKGGGSHTTGAEPKERVRLAGLHQRWDAVSFLHWRYTPEQIQPLLPDGLIAEVIDGSAWAGMVLFSASQTRLFGLADFPGGTRFPETNVRTYVRTPTGRTSVLFLTLEVGNANLARAGRMLRLPYRAANMSVHDEQGVWTYASRRGAIGHHVAVRPGPPRSGIDRGERDERLTGRWRATLPFARGRVVVPVEHERWPLHDAQLLQLDENLLAAVGLPAPVGAPDMLWSPGVAASVGIPRLRRQ